MARSKKVEFKFDFADELNKIKRRPLKTEFKNRIGELLIDNMKDFIASGRSPVKNVGPFKSYSDKYAKKKGSTTVNLELEGHMLDALEFKRTKDGVIVGIFDAEQRKKADNHNRGVTLPKRQFIPENGQSFKDEITRNIFREAIDEFEEEINEIIERSNRRR